MNANELVPWPDDRVNVPEFLEWVMDFHIANEKSYANGASVWFNADVMLYDALEAAHVALTTNTDDAINDFLTEYMNAGQS